MYFHSILVGKIFLDIVKENKLSLCPSRIEVVESGVSLSCRAILVFTQEDSGIFSSCGGSGRNLNTPWAFFSCMVLI